MAEDYIAVPVEQRASAYQRDCPNRGVMCGPCSPETEDASVPTVGADCRGGQCVLVVEPGD
jgi:hypothetical protein